MYSFMGLSGIDIAIWDLMGKACGQPLYKLWGAAKDRVVPYASLIRPSTPDERADLAVELMEHGWKAIKLRVHGETLTEDLAMVERVRQAVGEGMEIMVDTNQAQSSGNWQPGVLWDFRRAVGTAREPQRLGC
jgi:L-alanine-DL-glutamate epimerase-like enolase superfamily enzyme